MLFVTLGFLRQACNSLLQFSEVFLDSLIVRVIGGSDAGQKASDFSLLLEAAAK